MDPDPTENIVQTFWYGGTLSLWEYACLSSFLAFGYETHVYTYDAGLAVPAGVKLRDANEILPETEVFFYKDGPGTGSVAAFTNLFRYVLLELRGGWWVDTDVICLSRFPAAEGKAIVGLEAPNRVNGAIIYAPLGHALPRMAARHARSLGQNIRWGNAGPHLMTRLCIGSDSLAGIRVEPPETFYPIFWEKDVVSMLLLPSQRRAAEAACQNAAALHLYNEIFRRHRITKQKLPPVGSYLRTLFDRHASSDSGSRSYTVVGVRATFLAYYARRTFLANYARRVRAKILQPATTRFPWQKR
jgi:hypothetical protein